MANSLTEVDLLYGDYVFSGYEGQMIRLDRPYIHDRTANLLKRKPFQDAEFDLVRIDEVKGAHYAKRALLRVADGRTFGAGIGMPRKSARALLDQGHNALLFDFLASRRQASLAVLLRSCSIPAHV